MYDREQDILSKALEQEEEHIFLMLKLLRQEIIT